MVSKTVLFSLVLVAVLAAINWWVVDNRLEKKVWMTLLTNEKYLVGALTLDYSIKKYRSKYPLVVFHPDTLEESAKAELRKRNIRTKVVTLLLPTTHKEYGTDQRFYDCWSKLLPHGMTEFQRIVELDADMLLRDNADELMEMPLPPGTMAGTHACVCNPRKMSHYPADWVESNCAYTKQHETPDTAHQLEHAVDANFGTAMLNGGLQVIKPNRKRFDDMVNILANATLTDSFAFADQSLLSYYFKDHWISLPYSYNALKTMRHAHAPMWRDDRVKIVHYILNDKPWHDPLRENSEFVPNTWWWHHNNERLRVEKMAEIQKEIDAKIADNKAVIFSKSYCPHCRAAKEALKEHGSPHEVIELDLVDDGPLMQQYLSERSGVRTVPQIFVRGRFVGGNSDLQQIKSQNNGLKKLLA